MKKERGLKTEHVCARCGYTVKLLGEMDGRVKHLKDGGHSWSMRVKVGLGKW